ncbi:MAG: RNA polymerase sigma factor RpoD/SigA [Candidatus Gastranaerophilales bacterium]|nr:RNA polymerase sigma factor RpoD/SigA [Candidatus Gastranaerophilales bacterium]
MKNCEAAQFNSAKFVNIYSKDEENLSDYLKRIAKIPVLSLKEEQELAKKIKSGDLEAKKQLISANLRLAATVASKIKNPNMCFSDLLQEANMGLMIAVDKYDYKLGFKFSTYASWWIKQSVLKAISEQSGCVKVPVYVQEIVGKYSKMKSKLENELHINLSVKDMAERMNVDYKKLEEYINAFQANLSLDENISDKTNRETSLMDIIADENANATAKAEYENLKQALKEAMGVLKEREKSVVILRYGLEDDNKKTLDEIGKIFGITKECVRQTEIRALKRLRTYCNTNDMLACN